MPVYFVDSSTLVKRYRHEAGSERVTQLLNSAERLVASRLTHVEVSAAIARRARTTGIPMVELTRVFATIDRDLRDSFDVVELDALVVEQALSLTRKHGLRAADALQLSCAILAMREMSQDFIVLASDQELNAAAMSEGMWVVDPTQP